MAEVRLARSQGLKNTLPVERLADGFRIPGQPEADVAPAEYVVAKNVDIDDSFYASSRSGTTLLVPGSGFTSMWSNGETVFYVRDNAIYSLDANYTSKYIVGNVSDHVTFLQVQDRFYWSDGVSRTGIIEHGVSRNWGMPIPDNFDIQIIAGHMKAGRYLLAVTYGRMDGIESGSTEPLLLELPDDSGIRIVANSLPDEVDGINLYCSYVNGEQLFFADSGDTTVEFKGGFLGHALDTLLLDAPVIGKHLTHHKGIIYMSVDEFVFATKPLAYELMDVRDFITVDGSKITALAAVDSGLFVGTEQGVSFLKGTSLAEMTISTVRETGVVEGSLVYADGDKVTGRAELAGRNVVLFATQTGVLLGLPDGDVLNLTYDKYRFDTSMRGTAVFRDSPTLHQYLFFNY